jgi:monothiol glutaredoxin
MIDNPVVTRIRNEVERSAVVAFLNGTPLWPTCSGSAAVAHHLSDLGIAFKSLDVTTDPELREGLRTFAELDEIPQVYIQGALLGGGEAIRDLAETGELAMIMQEQGIATNR